MSDNLRDLCMKLLGELSDDGLFEAYEAMQRIRAFYQECAQYVPPPSPFIIPLRKAIKSPTTVSEDFPLDLDDL